MKQIQLKGFLHRAVSGVIIGAGAIIPGVSGSVMAVSLGIYEETIKVLYGLLRNLRKNFKDGVMYLAPLGVGGVAGVGVMALALTWLMAHFRNPVLLLFMGLVVGGLPGLAKEGNQDGFKPRYLWAACGGVLTFALIAFLENRAGVSGAAVEALTPMEGLFSGMICGLAIVPGVSISFLLMLLGWYDAFLSSISALQIHTLFFAGIGFVVSFAACLALVHYVFNRVRAYGYHAVTGFTAASAVYLIGRTVLAGLPWWQLLFLAAGIVGGYLSAKKENT